MAKNSHRLAVVDGVLQRFVGQLIPLLWEAHTQHLSMPAGVLDKERPLPSCESRLNNART